MFTYIFTFCVLHSIVHIHAFDKVCLPSVWRSLLFHVPCSMSVVVMSLLLVLFVCLFVCFSWFWFLSAIVFYLCLYLKLQFEYRILCWHFFFFNPSTSECNMLLLFFSPGSLFLYFQNFDLDVSVGFFLLLLFTLLIIFLTSWSCRFISLIGFLLFFLQIFCCVILYIVSLWDSHYTY